MKMLNDDTTQILLAIVIGTIVCWFIFRNGGNNGFSVGSQSCTGVPGCGGYPRESGAPSCQSITTSEAACKAQDGCFWTSDEEARMGVTDASDPNDVEAAIQAQACLSHADEPGCRSEGTGCQWVSPPTINEIREENIIRSIKVMLAQIILGSGGGQIPGDTRETAPNPWRRGSWGTNSNPNRVADMETLQGIGTSGEGVFAALHELGDAYGMKFVVIVNSLENPAEGPSASGKTAYRKRLESYFDFIKITHPCGAGGCATAGALESQRIREESALAAPSRESVLGDMFTPFSLLHDEKQKEIYCSRNTIHMAMGLDRYDPLLKLRSTKMESYNKKQICDNTENVPEADLNPEQEDFYGVIKNRRFTPQGVKERLKDHLTSGIAGVRPANRDTGDNDPGYWHSVPGGVGAGSLNHRETTRRNIANVFDAIFVNEHFYGNRNNCPAVLMDKCGGDDGPEGEIACRRCLKTNLDYLYRANCSIDYVKNRGGGEDVKAWPSYTAFQSADKDQLEWCGHCTKDACDHGSHANEYGHITGVGGGDSWYCPTGVCPRVRDNTKILVVDENEHFAQELRSAGVVDWANNWEFAIGEEGWTEAQRNLGSATMRQIRPIEIQIKVEQGANTEPDNVYHTSPTPGDYKLLFIDGMNMMGTPYQEILGSMNDICSRGAWEGRDIGCNIYVQHYLINLFYVQYLLLKMFMGTDNIYPTNINPFLNINPTSRAQELTATPGSFAEAVQGLEATPENAQCKASGLDYLVLGLLKSGTDWAEPLPYRYDSALIDDLALKTTAEAEAENLTPGFNPVHPDLNVATHINLNNNGLCIRPSTAAEESQHGIKFVLQHLKNDSYNSVIRGTSSSPDPSAEQAADMAYTQLNCNHLDWRPFLATSQGQKQTCEQISHARPDSIYKDEDGKQLRCNQFIDKDNNLCTDRYLPNSTTPNPWAIEPRRPQDVSEGFNCRFMKRQPNDSRRATCDPSILQDGSTTQGTTGQPWKRSEPAAGNNDSCWNGRTGQSYRSDSMIPPGCTQSWPHVGRGNVVHRPKDDV